MCKHQEDKGNNEQSKRLMIPTWGVVLGLVILLLVCIAIIYFIIHRMGVNSIDPEISVENWFSYLVTLIGACATIIVGFQIYNFIDVRNITQEFSKNNRENEKKVSERLNDINEKINKYKDLGKQLDGTIELLYSHSCILSDTTLAFATQMEKDGKKIEAIQYYLLSISCLPQNTNIDILIERIKRLRDALLQSISNTLSIPEKESLKKLKNQLEFRTSLFLTLNDDEQKKEELINLKATCIEKLNGIIN